MKKCFFILVSILTLLLMGCSSSRVLSPDIREPLEIVYDLRPADIPNLVEIDKDWGSFQKAQTITINCASYKNWGEQWKSYAEKLEEFCESLSDVLNK